MKTQETLNAALKKYEDERAKLDHQLDVVAKILSGDLEVSDTKTVSFEDAKRIAAFAVEKQVLEQQKKEIDFKIRFAKWVLE